MTTTLNVLCPNGRRQNVKVNPNTTVLQILEEVCLKQQFDVAYYDLRHGRTVLDVAAAYRYTGIPNNAKLEMVVRESPRLIVSEVTIALQLPNGERRQKEFPPNTSLLDLVLTFQNGDENLLMANIPEVPVIIYMRDEILGQLALQHTTLRSLGILSGKAALRLVYRQVEQAVLDNIASDIQMEKIKLQKYAEKPVNNATKQIDAPEGIPRAEPSINKETPDPLIPSPSVYSSSTPHTSQQHPSSNVETSSTQVPMEISLTTSLSVRPEVTRPIQGISYIPQAMPEFKFPEETAGKDLYRNELSEAQVEDGHTCDRQPVVFSLDDDAYAAHVTNEELPDEFFEVTKDDILVMMKHLKDQISQEENAPLMTSSMRQARAEAYFDNYDMAVIRFKFPNKLILQAKFKPRETVYSLIKFVRSNLSDSNTSFYLYCTPPKQILKDNCLTLIQAKLVPMAIVYVGVEGPNDFSLSESALALKTNRTNADQIAIQGFSSSQDSNNPSLTSDTYNRPADTSRPSHSANQHKVPKWYKGSGK